MALLSWKQTHTPTPAHTHSPIAECVQVSLTQADNPVKIFYLQLLKSEVEAAVRSDP